LLLCTFFFSSRRRHTRFSRDWSSDVCSSDLLAFAGIEPVKRSTEVRNALVAQVDEMLRCNLCPDKLVYRGGRHRGYILGNDENRSEERRVGKERRSGRATNQ